MKKKTPKPQPSDFVDKQGDKQRERDASKARQLANLEGHKWGKGQSGNKDGRPPSEFSFTSITKSCLPLPAPPRLLGQLALLYAPEWLEDFKVFMKVEVINYGQALALKNLAKVQSLQHGDHMAVHVWDRIDGKIPVRIAGAEGGPVKIQNVNLKKLSTDQVRQLRELMLLAAGTDASDETGEGEAE